MTKHNNLTDSGRETSSVRQDVEALFALGNRRLAEAAFIEAEACFREALLLDPHCAEASGNLALVLEKRGAITEAETCYLRALRLNPTLASCASNYANWLSGQKRFVEAEAMHRRALALVPHSPIFWTNLGVLHAELQRDDEAEACHRRAIASAPDYATARFNLSYLLLRQGQFEEGWQCFEARNWYAALAARIPVPRWQGESLQGKAVLIGSEAGYGDMIQFCRYVPLLKAQGARRIDMICHPALVRLFQSLEGIDTLISYDQALPPIAWDTWSPMMSLPLHCGTRLETIPAPIPYLRAEQERVNDWENRLPQGGLRVGIAWQGNPQYENDAARSLPSLALLKPLSEVNHVRLVSLQKGRGEDEAEAVSATWPLANLAPHIEDFADTAALIAQLDLVISVDTAVAHLAGALGKPCWVLLPDFMTDWRWLTERRDTPWYPQATRLFRQSARRDWVETIAEVTSALQGLAGNP